MSNTIIARSTCPACERPHRVEVSKWAFGHSSQTCTHCSEVFSVVVPAMLMNGQHLRPSRVRIGWDGIQKSIQELENENH